MASTWQVSTGDDNRAGDPREILLVTIHQWRNLKSACPLSQAPKKFTVNT